MLFNWVSVALFFLSSTLVSNSFAADRDTAEVSSSKQVYPLDLKSSTWSLETHLNAVASTNGPALGASVFYNLDFENEAGFRLQSSLYGKVYAQTYSFVYRNIIGEEKLNLFLELALGFNHYIDNENNYLNNPFIGTSLGFINHWKNKVSWGVITGLEWSQSQITPRSVALDRSNLYLYGNLMFLTSVAL